MIRLTVLSDEHCCEACGSARVREVRRTKFWRGFSVKMQCEACGKTWQEHEESEGEDAEAGPLRYERPSRPRCEVSGCAGHQVVYRTVGTVRYLKCSRAGCTWRGKGS